MPEEILSKVFSYLCISDRLQCRLVCKLWYWAFLHPQLHARTALVFTNDDDLLYQAIEGSLLSSSCHLTTAAKGLYMEQVSLDIFAVKPLTDWQCLLSNLRRLHLSEAAVVTDTGLVHMLSHCRQLVSFTLRHARDILMSGTLLASDEVRGQLAKTLSNVSHLDLSSNSPHLSDRLFNRIVDCMPRLTHLVLNETQILSHVGVYKKHYPSSVPSFSSPSVLTWKNVLRFLEERSNLLVALDLYASNITGEGLRELGRLSQLKLRQLNVGLCLDIRKEDLADFLSFQGGLQRLTLDHCRRVLVDRADVSLFGRLKELKQLSLIGLSSAKDLDKCLAELSRLEDLDLNQADVSSQQVTDGLLAAPAATLKVLKMSSIRLSVELAPLLTQLSQLEVDDEGLKDATLISVIDHCQNLETLKLSHCHQLSQESLARLPCLRALRCLTLVEIPVENKVLEAGLRFSDLRHFCLSPSQRFDGSGLECFAMNNQRLESLTIRKCLLGKNTISVIAHACPRLRDLDLRGSIGVSVQMISDLFACGNLRCLRLTVNQRQEAIRVEELRLQMPRLRIFETDADLNEILGLQPPPPPPPPLMPF